MPNVPTSEQEADSLRVLPAATKRRKKGITAIHRDAVKDATMGAFKQRSLVYDTETTGLLKPEISDLEQQPRIIEFALVELNFEREIVAQHSWLINPGMPISAEITKITGLTDADLFDKPSFIEVLPEIEAAFLGVDRLIAHNLPFDMGMLTNELRRVGREYAFPYPPNQVCTVQLASELIFGRRAKMTELYEKIMGKKLHQTHRALDDVKALVEIVQTARW